MRDALVVGCGGIGSRYDAIARVSQPLTHAGAYAGHPGVRLVGGVDPDAEARSAFEERWGAPTFETVEQALAECAPSLVSLAIPARDQPDAVRAVLSAGPDAIWAEKPLAPTSAAAADIAERCAEAGVALQVNFLRRFDPLHREVATAIGDAPEALHMDVRFSGTLANFGSHAFDLFRWFGGEAQWVEAVEVPGADPTVVMGGGPGVSATFSQVRNEQADVFDVNLYLRDSRLTITSLGEQLLRARPEPDALFEGFVSLGAPSAVDVQGIQHAMTNGLHGLLAHLDRGEPLACTGRDGVEALRLEEAAHEALARGGRVAVSHE